MFRIIKPAADVDELQCIENPGRQMRVGKAVEMIAPLASLLDQAVSAKLGKVLGNPGGRKIERGGEGCYVFLAEPQLLDQAQAISMGKQSEQVGKFPRND